MFNKKFYSDDTLALPAFKKSVVLYSTSNIFVNKGDALSTGES